MSIVNAKRQWLSRDFIIRVSEVLNLLFLVAIDQYVKYWFQMRDLVVMNPGGVFGLWPSLRWMGLWLVWAVLVWEWKQMKLGTTRFGLGFIVAGGFSNLFDRVCFGSVRDYIYYSNFGFYGNMADILLAVGVIVLVGQWLFCRNDRIAS